MSKKQARRQLAQIKPGCTVKEFLTLCADMGFWFDTVSDFPEMQDIYYTLTAAR